MSTAGKIVATSDSEGHVLLRFVAGKETTFVVSMDSRSARDLAGSLEEEADLAERSAGHKCELVYGQKRNVPCSPDQCKRPSQPQGPQRRMPHQVPQNRPMSQVEEKILGDTFEELIVQPTPIQAVRTPPPPDVVVELKNHASDSMVAPPMVVPRTDEEGCDSKSQSVGKPPLPEGGK